MTVVEFIPFILLKGKRKVTRNSPVYFYTHTYFEIFPTFAKDVSASKSSNVSKTDMVFPGLVSPSTET